MSLIREPSGEPIGFTWLMRDAAERKAAEIELRRLLVETQRRERWLEVISEIRLILLGGGDLEDWLELIATRVCELADTENSSILLEEHAGEMTFVTCVGDAMSGLQGHRFPVDGTVFGTVLASGEVWRSAE